MIADEAARTPRFARAIAGALTVDAPAVAEAPAASPAPALKPPAKRAARRSKRTPRPFNPFAVYHEGGETGLRDRLVPLEIEQLKDIIAETRSGRRVLFGRAPPAQPPTDSPLAQVILCADDENVRG